MAGKIEGRCKGGVAHGKQVVPPKYEKPSIILTGDYCDDLEVTTVDP